MLIETLPLSEKEKHIRGSYNLDLLENKTWESKWIGQDEKGEWKLGKLLRIEAGERLPLHYHHSTIPTTYLPQEGGWAFIGIDRQGTITERYFIPKDGTEKENKVDYFPEENIKIEEGMIYTFLAHPYDGRVSLFKYSEPENTFPLIRLYDPNLKIDQKERDIRRFTQLVDLIEDKAGKFY